MHMLTIILAIIGGLFCAWWMLSFLIGTLGNKTSIGIKNVRYRLKKSGIDPDSLTSKQVESIAAVAAAGGWHIKNGRHRFDSVEFQRQLDFLTAVVSRHLKGEHQDTDFTELARRLLGENTDA